jgi:hypothetical protein
MIFRNYACDSKNTYQKLRIIAYSRQSTAHLIDPQTLFSLVSGEKAVNQN